PDAADSLALVHGGWQAGGGGGGGGACARGGYPAVAGPSGSESSVHPRRGIVAHAGARGPERTAADGNHAVGRTHGAHAGAYLVSARRVGDGGGSQRARSGGRPAVLRDDRGD